MIWRPAWYAPISARRALKAGLDSLRAEVDRLTGVNALLEEEVELLDGIISAGSAESGRCRTIAECTRVCHRLQVAEARLALIDSGEWLPTREEVLDEVQRRSVEEAL